MIFNLLDRVTPDNIPDGSNGLNTAGLFTLTITLLAIFITIIAAYIIIKLYKQIAILKNSKPEKIIALIWIATIVICILFVILCVAATETT